MFTNNHFIDSKVQLILFYQNYIVIKKTFLK